MSKPDDPPVDYSTLTNEELGIIRLADVPDPQPPKFPQARFRGRAPRRFLVLRLADGREYKVADDPARVLGLLHHLSLKTWCDSKFIHYAIGRIAKARDWTIHPF